MCQVKKATSLNNKNNNFVAKTLLSTFAGSFQIPPQLPALPLPALHRPRRAEAGARPDGGAEEGEAHQEERQRGSGRVRSGCLAVGLVHGVGPWVAGLGDGSDAW